MTLKTARKPARPTARTNGNGRSTRTENGVWQRLTDLAMNLWWTWNPDAMNLFASMDVGLWNATHHNPIKTMRMLPPERREIVETDPNFAEHLSRVERALVEYLEETPWFDRTYGKQIAKQKGGRPPTFAYFCAEFAIHESLPQYSGGLGVLAGDHVKSASDLGLPFVAIGLLYRCGYYTQELAPDGSTRVIYPKLDFADCPITDTETIIDVPMGGTTRTTRAKIWRQQVGRVPIYLLDTDVEGNSPKDRELTRHLYGGDREYRIQQEILLGVGGVLALEAMGVEATVCHMNEGHAAFAALERLRRIVGRGESLDEAERQVRASSVFTTHTPVPAGNDRFDPKLTLKYIGHYAKELGLTNDELLGLGRENPADKNEQFTMTVLALRLTDRCNGVAKLHGDTSRKMWLRVYGETNPERVPIRSVTNGIHSQTWLAPEMRPLYDKYLKPKWNGAGPDDNFWSRAKKIPANELWETRRLLRSKLVRFARRRLIESLIRQHADQQLITDAQTVLDDDTLTICFARRFATYKRGTLIFSDPKRLAKILCDEKRPVQLIFAGKAHPADMGGQQFAQKIFQLSQEERFKGRVVILEDYDMELGRVLTSGADVWLNNPLRPQEASGTSGMKPPLHGGLNCSILDGWWPEAYDKKNGWAIGDETQLADQKKQDARDAKSIYELIENEIVPDFYESRDKNGVPKRWAARMVDSMQTVCAQFSTTRMVSEYCRDYYMPAHSS